MCWNFERLITPILSRSPVINRESESNGSRPIQPFLRKQGLAVYCEIQGVKMKTNIMMGFMQLKDKNCYRNCLNLRLHFDPNIFANEGVIVADVVDTTSSFLLLPPDDDSRRFTWRWRFF
jgi:hypothetical protein